MSEALLSLAALAAGLLGGIVLSRRLGAAFIGGAGVGRGGKGAAGGEPPAAAAHLARTLMKQLEEHHRYGSQFSIIYLEFPPDDKEVVALVGYTLRTCTRLVDEVGYTGNRVVVVLPHIGPEDCAAATKRLAGEIAKAAGGDRYTVATASYPRDSKDIEELVAKLSEP